MPNYEAMTGFANGIKEGLMAYQTMKQINRTNQMEGLLKGIQEGPNGLEFTPQKKQQMALEQARMQREQSFGDVSSPESLKYNQFAKETLGQQLPEGMSASDIKTLLPSLLAARGQTMKQKPAIDEEMLSLQKEKLKSEINKNKREPINKLGNGEEKNLPQNVFAAATYGQRIADANKQISDLIAGGYDPTTIGASAQGSKYFPDILMSDNAKLMDQAQRNFINSVLRRESGSAISEGEFLSARKQYLPQQGDTPDVLKQKQRNREVAQAGLMAEGAKALPRLQKNLPQDNNGGGLIQSSSKPAWAK